MSYFPINPFISKSVIISSSSLVLIRWLCALCKLAVYIVFAALNLILDCLGLELAVAVPGGLFTRQPLFYVPCDPYVLV